MNKETKEKLLADGMSTKNPAEHDTLSKEIKHLDWLGLYISPNKLSNAYPDNVLSCSQSSTYPSLWTTWRVPPSST